MANVFTKIDADEADQKITIGKEMISLRISVEANTRILRNHVNRLKEILSTYGSNGTTPLFNAEETLNIQQTIQFLIYGGGSVAMAKVDGLPFEGIDAIVSEAKALVV